MAWLSLSTAARVPSDKWTSASAANARSFLFVPADRPERVDKALNSAADAVIVDLEDGVGGSAKVEARSALESWTSMRPYLLRINSPGSPFQRDDVERIASLRRVCGVVIPKVERVDDVAAVVAAIPDHLQVFALVETAVGLLDAPAIAASGVVRLLFGSADYVADLGATPTRELLSHPRSVLVIASAAAGIAPPVDGPTLTLGDPAAVETESTEARALGFGGKLCIHPGQIDAVNAAFSPSAAEVEWAEQLLSQSVGDGAVAVNGQMVDAAVLRRARRILASRISNS